ncbi:MAG: putative manganese-dependent inorganic diphosphatase [Bacillota bacterium]|nr:putative manganese-dependent inorganic diphosphatase [Bacillota bacterium]
MDHKETVYISGHRNPDSDSICAAIAYADLKNRRGKVSAVPIRLGNLSRETKFILDYFNVQAPILKETMKPQVKDLTIDPPYRIAPTTTLSKALNIIKNEDISALQVVNENDELLGIVTLSNLTDGYMDIWDDNVLGRSQTSLENIVEVMRGEVLYQPADLRPLNGRMAVYAMEAEQAKDNIQKYDIVIVGNREDAQKDAILKEVSILILTVGSHISKENIDLAKKHGVTIITTELDSFLAARLLPLAVPVSYVMTKDKLVKFKADDFVDDISTIMGNTRYRSYPIVDHKNQVLGSISRYHLISNKKKSLILVDHNERNQSVQDLEYAEIIEIIDHHRVANIATSQPIFFRNLPVGSTSTIISMMYFEQGVSPSKEIAGILCGAIISDTLLLRSPTSTDEDQRMLTRMAKIAGINIEDFANQMFKAGTSLEGKTPKEILSQDTKEFTIEGERVKVSQVFSMDRETIKTIGDSLVAEMKKSVEDGQGSTYLLLFTDILEESSEIIVVGDYDQEIAAAFGSQLKNNSFTAPGVLSRKKQVIPNLTKAIAKKKQGLAEVI